MGLPYINEQTLTSSIARHNISAVFRGITTQTSDENKNNDEASESKKVSATALKKSKYSNLLSIIKGTDLDKTHPVTTA